MREAMIEVDPLPGRLVAWAAWLTSGGSGTIAAGASITPAPQLEIQDLLVIQVVKEIKEMFVSSLRKVWVV